MARDILSEFGPDRRVEGPQIQGGVERARDVNNYQPPQGPRHVMDTGRGLRGGDNFGNAGSQGKSSLDPQSGGTPGQLTDDTHPDGSQR